ncbi:uncharacterized protein NEMAJ01_0252 [Nematocida major]|uniref:uncharacterized protein n=1 Tax=Nematocida major TaxID=1912982 RepID=UPI002008896C|nr:uncharacterized protein NEMAJ01_0252 [Nematocida major]KAH9385356.1 hypothetical protein NEMAJ01_0252 [Nematocida major]
MKAHFANAGITFPSDTFYVNYIMRLCMGNCADDTDRANVQALQKMVDAILSRPQAKQAEGNVVHEMSFLRARAVNMKELVRRALYFDRYFRGYSIFGMAFFGTIIIWILSVAFDASLFSFSSNSQKILNEVDKVVEAKNKIVANNSVTPDEIHIIDRTIELVANNLCIQFLFEKMQRKCTIIMLFAFVITSTLSKTKFYKLCKQNIKTGTIKVGDFILAQTIEMLLRASLFVFIIQTSLYVLFYRVLDKTIVKYCTVGHFWPISLIFFQSLLVGVHVLFLNLAPIPAKLCSLASVGWFCVLSVLPAIFFMLLNLRVVGSQFAHSCVMRNCLMAPWEDPDYASMISNLPNRPLTPRILTYLLMYAHRLAKFFMTISPSDYVFQLLPRIMHYQGKLWPRPEENLASVWGPYLNVNKHNGSNDQTEILASRAVEDLCNTDLAPHEAYDSTVSLKEISIFRLAWGVPKFWILPLLLLAGSAYYTYRALQPKLRR